jgi:hypothetical protein
MIKKENNKLIKIIHKIKEEFIDKKKSSKK